MYNGHSFHIINDTVNYKQTGLALYNASHINVPEGYRFITFNFHTKPTTVLTSTFAFFGLKTMSPDMINSLFVPNLQLRIINREIFKRELIRKSIINFIYAEKKDILLTYHYHIRGNIEKVIKFEHIKFDFSNLYQFYYFIKGIIYDKPIMDGITSLNNIALLLCSKISIKENGKYEIIPYYYNLIYICPYLFPETTVDDWYELLGIIFISILTDEEIIRESQNTEIEITSVIDFHNYIDHLNNTKTKPVNSWKNQLPEIRYQNLPRLTNKLTDELVSKLLYSIGFDITVYDSTVKMPIIGLKDILSEKENNYYINYIYGIFEFDEYKNKDSNFHSITKIKTTNRTIETGLSRYSNKHKIPQHTTIKYFIIMKEI